MDVEGGSTPPNVALGNSNIGNVAAAAAIPPVVEEAPPSGEQEQFMDDQLGAVAPQEQASSTYGGGALGGITELTAHDDIEDAVAANRPLSTTATGDAISVTSMSVSNSVARSTSKYPKSTSSSVNGGRKKKGVTSDSTSLTEQEQPTSNIPATHLLISRQLLRFLIAAAVLGMTLGSVGFIVSLIGLFEDDESTVSAQDSNGLVDPNQANVTVATSLLEGIYERGFLKCGLGTFQPGFFFPEDGVTTTDATTNEEGEQEEPSYVGLDVDLCSTLAAAVLGDSGAFQVHQFPMNERWLKLNSTEVDVVFRSTYNLEHDVYVAQVGTGFEFSTPYFYDGLTYGGSSEFVDCAEAGLTNGTCADLRICVARGTAFHDVINSLFPTENVVAVPEGNFLEVFPNGGCNVLAGDKIQVSEISLQAQGITMDNYVVGTAFVAKDPISMVSRQGDRRWTDFIEMVFQSLIFAENHDITQVSAMEMPSTSLFGPNFESMFKNAVAAHGNYGELYNANLEHFVPRAGLNLLNSDGAGGSPMIWSFPFGNLAAEGPALEEISPTAKAIRERGFLRCGTTELVGFAELDESREFVGLDADLCRAVSAAFFDGVDRTFFSDIGYRLRWENLLADTVDLLALSTTWNVPRDVKEPSTQVGFTFTDAYIFVWHSYGGRPEFVECAENVDVVSPVCQGLRVCVDADTTSYDELLERFRNDFYLVPVVDSTQAAGQLRDGACNVYYVTIGEAQERRIRANGYGDDLPYTLGKEKFSVEPFSMVTREDDPVWSDFVRWVFWSLVYAEENGITQETAHLMPTTNIFGPYRSKAFYHAVNAVGNYGELYERTMQPFIERSGPNNLNNNKEGRIYAIPGFE